MSSLLKKLNKNANEFNILEAYGKMTPQQIQGAIQVALNAQKRELVNEFNIQFDKLKDEYNDSIKINFKNVIDIISVELLYELAKQMGYWDLKSDTEEDEYVKESIKFRVREIFENTMEKVQGYADMKYEKMASKEFESKKKKIRKEFEINFK